MERLNDILDRELKIRGLNERVAVALLDAAFGLRVRNSTYRSLAEVSDEVAGKDLRMLAAQGLLAPHGERRGRYYVASDWLQKTRLYVRETKVVTDPFTDTQTIRKPPSSQDYLPGFGPPRPPQP